MERIIASLLLIFSTDFVIESLPIKNGFSVKFKPISTKEDVHPKTLGAIFAKISQEFTPEAILRREIFAKSLPPPSPELGAGCSNQVARVMFPLKRSEGNLSSGDHTQERSERQPQEWRGVNYLNLPLIKQPYKDYKVLVAEAPPEMKMENKNEKIVIYVVFSENGTVEPNMVSLPEIYFVNKPVSGHGSNSINNKNNIKHENEKYSPMLIVDQNRTVTGLKRKNIEKFLKFRNSLLKRYSYTTN